MFLTSKLLTCFIDGSTSKRKSQSIAYLLNGSEHIYIYIYSGFWTLTMNEVHSIWVTTVRENRQLVIDKLVEFEK